MADAPRLLRPSRSAQWGSPCGASHTMEGHFPDDADTPEQREGTAGHFYVTEGLEGRTIGVGWLAPNGHPIDQEMIDHGNGYIENAHRWVAAMRAGDPDALVRVETKVFAHQSIHPLCEGTPDLFGLSLKLKLVVVDDYKYGHRYVDPFELLQEVCYFAGIMEGAGLTPEEYADFTVVFRVGQPRSYHPDGPYREWTTTGANLYRLVCRLRAAAIVATSPSAQCVSGPQCYDCSAAARCEVNLRSSGDVIEYAGAARVVELTPLGLGRMLSAIDTAQDRLKALHDALSEEALALMRAGKIVPEWQMGYVNSRPVWTVEPPEVVAMGTLFGANLAVNDAITPAQAVKALQAKGVAEVDAKAIVAAYSRKPTGAAKLTRADRRAAIKAFT